MKPSETYTKAGEFYLRHKNWLYPIAFLGLAAGSAFLGEVHSASAQTTCGDGWKFTGMVNLAGGIRALAAEVPAHLGLMEVFNNLGCVVGQARQAGVRLPDEAFARMLAGFTDFRQAANAIIAPDGSLFLRPNSEGLRLLFPVSDPAAAEAEMSSGVRSALAIKIMGFLAETLSSPWTPWALAGAAIALGGLTLWKLNVYHPEVISVQSRGGQSSYVLPGPAVNQEAETRLQHANKAHLSSALHCSQLPGVTYASMTGDYDTGLKIEELRGILSLEKASRVLADTLQNYSRPEIRSGD